MRMAAAVVAMMVLAQAGCGGGGARPSRDNNEGGLMLQTAQFEFINSDDEQRPLVRGTLVLPWPVQEGQSVRGSWESRYVGPRSTTGPAVPVNELGPQVGRGTLQAEREGEHVRINLNPEMADNNVVLLATVEDDGALRGRWEYLTFVGVAATGSFEARRQDSSR